MNKPIKYPLAKLLKEKGFTEQVNNYFGDNGKEEIFQPKYTGNYNSHVMVGLVTSRPNLIDVIMWIYEKHGIWIEVRRTNFFKEFRFQAYFNEKPLTGELGGYVSHELPTEAYLAAIEYILNNLI